MKLIQVLAALGLGFYLILELAKVASSQSENQSDITGNNTNEVLPPQTSENQSDITVPNPPEIKAEDNTSNNDETGLSERALEEADIESTSRQTDESKKSTVESEEVEREEYDQAFQIADFGEAIQQFEELQAVEFSDQLELNFYGEIPSKDEISHTLNNLFQVTGKKAALIYISSQEDELQLLPIFPKTPNASADAPRQIASAGRMTAQESDRDRRTIVRGADRKSVQNLLQKFFIELTNPARRGSSSYLRSSQQLYQWIVAPLEAELEANQIDILIFTMDRGLRSVPLGALHDGKQFLVEKYGVAIVPSFGLTDTRYVDIRNLPILAMGASQFKDQAPLPAVPVELSKIITEGGSGQSFLNEQFTLENFKVINREQRFGIIHLATHGEFRPGDLSNSYIQFWNSKLSLDKLSLLAQELGWNTQESPPVEMLVLSACRTAVGDEQAELGFAGLAVQAGVKTAIASLWYVSDAGSLGLMSEFYKQLKTTPIKSQALRQAQLAMLRGQVRIENSQLRLSDGEIVPLPPEVIKRPNINLSHPYFWSAYMMIGNWN